VAPPGEAVHFLALPSFARGAMARFGVAAADMAELHSVKATPTCACSVLLVRAILLSLIPTLALRGTVGAVGLVLQSSNTDV